MMYLYHMKCLPLLFLLPIAVQAQSFERAMLDTTIIIDPILSATNTVAVSSCLMYERVDLQTGRKEIFRRVDKMPLAGYDIMAYLSKQLSLPKSNTDNICAKTIVQFTIETSGVIKHPRILKSCNPQLDEQILSAIRKMPKWQPAEQRGKPIAILYNLPVLIDLE